MSDELSKLKSLVRRFLKEIQGIPMRAIDCDQETVHKLKEELHEATGSRRGESMNCRRTKRAFTLTEVLVVIAILGILAGLLIPAIQAARNNAKNFRENQNAEEANKNSLYMSTARYDGHMWVMNRTMDYFLHHPDCPCKGVMAEKEEK